MPAAKTVKKIGYPYSKPNLVKAFTKNLEEFILQNGKKRGAKLK